MAKPTKTLMLLSRKLQPNIGEFVEYSTLYKSMVGSLKYMALTRPDLSFATSIYTIQKRGTCWQLRGYFDIYKVHLI